MTDELQDWTIVFDLDGTLVNTAPDLVAALNHVLQSEDLDPAPMSEVHSLVGRGAKAMIRTGIEYNGADPDKFNFDVLWDKFIAYYSENIAVHSHPYEQSVDVLEALQASKATLAVCTNKPQELANLLLSSLNMSRFFNAIVGFDGVPYPKPHGDHIQYSVIAAGGRTDRAIMVGDSQTDKKAARNAGLPFIFVPFGYEAAGLDKIEADIVVSHYSDMIDAISTLTG